LKHYVRIALFAALFHSLPAWADILGNDACQKIMAEGSALLGQGKAREAWEAFERARKADPTASAPVAWIASLLKDAASHATGDEAAGLRHQAQSAAREALRIDRQDPVAQEVLRQLDEDAASPLHVASPEAAAALAEGENLFAQRRYAEALAKYELAATRDPALSAAWVYAGDCFYSRQQWHEAELRFLKATEVEPLNSQAWRFLSDALAMQGKHEAAEAALVNGIAAHPGQLPNWDKLDNLMRHEGLPLKRLDLMPAARASTNPSTGQTTIEIDAGKMKDNDDLAIWIVLAGAHTGVQDEANGQRMSPFKSALFLWQLAMKIADQKEAEGKSKLHDPGLLAMQKLAKANQLEPAILLLTYREAYRPEFEEWKRAHPDGVKAFIATYGLRP
jgi:tetratricopeptide (TPR) repeat protein